MLYLLLLILVIISLSALCSVVETATISIPISRARQLVEESKSGSEALLEIKRNQDDASSAIVILNNLSNIAGSMMITATVIDVVGSWWVGIFSGLLTFLIIIFAEILPKNYGYQYPEKVALNIAPFLSFTVRCMSFIIIKPIKWFTEKIIPEPTKKLIQERDALSMLKLACEDGNITEEEYTMAKKVFRLNDVLAQDIFTPRTKMTCLNQERTLDECKKEIISSQHSRIPIYDKNIDTITGFVLKMEMLIALINNAEVGKKKIKTFSKEVIKVYTKSPANEVLNRLRRQQQHLAIVMGKYYGVEGVVSLEDIIELITGEIRDETDEDLDLEKTAHEEAIQKLKEDGIDIENENTK